MAQNLDLLLLAREWEHIDLPKEKKYLLKYFDTSLQYAFVKYFHIFGDYLNFPDHTGVPCCSRWLETLYSRIQTLEKIRSEARRNRDMELLVEIESGRYKIDRKCVKKLKF